MRNKEFRRNLLTIATTAAIIILGGGVYLYYYFFRQMNAQLMETIPTDAAFLFQINDNETFVKSVKSIHPYISPFFGLDAYPGCQFFIDQLPGKYNQVVFSGHDNGEAFSILFACKIHENAFKHLLSKLQIDEKNCITFERCKIYTFGTHLKRFVFTYHKGIFLASENLTLLKKSINQLKNPKNLTTLKSFEELFSIIEKNKKQNWLILNHERYFSNFKPYFNDETNGALIRFSSNIPWAAHQVRFSGLEMLLTGYATPMLPLHKDYEMAIRDANTEYWSQYLSELGMKKSPVAQMKSLSFSLDSLNSELWMSNGLIKF
ncbi:MAG: hypothetical protein FWC34_06725 [Bacteroidetes bacterium]|nr:hypothetical protein [Bacteroidota bacterium]MCL2303611.1 hypothetical protein [Lentimicrobiaceae bacterium]